MNEIEFQTLVRELTALPQETEWVEFKHNKTTPEEIGEYNWRRSNQVAQWNSAGPIMYLFGHRRYVI